MSRIDLQREIEFFDGVGATEGDYDALHEDAYERLLCIFERRVDPRPGETCADLGCGTGAFTRHLRRYRLDLIGIDISSVCVALAREQASTERYLEADIRQTGLADGSCDIVVYSGVLHHCPDRASRDEVFSEGRRILRAGGRLFAFDPSAHSPTMWLYRDPRSPFHSTAGKTPNEVLLDRHELRDELSRLGFNAIEIRGIGGMTFRRIEGSRARLLLPIYNLYERALARSPLADRFGTFLVTTATRG